jgi:hypothetical protein
VPRQVEGALLLARTYRSLEPMHRAEQALKLLVRGSESECAIMKTPFENSERDSRLAELDAAIARGVADADGRRVKPASEVFDALQMKLEARANADQR